MRFKLYREYGALNSPLVFNAVELGLRTAGHEIVTDGEDVAVIWSVLWQGRMANNQKIYQEARRQGKQVLIIEVGNLKRNHTWRISLEHINGQGNFANFDNLDVDRPQKLGVKLEPVKEIRRPEILIATQHQASLQWQGMPTMPTWAKDTVYKLQQYTKRKIIIRPHPRSPFRVDLPGTVMEAPQKVTGSYDDFNINYNYHCVINYNSGPAVQAAIQGVPVICDRTSLAGILSEKIENIENIKLPDRSDWFLKLCHTEWTVDEIQQGMPFFRLIPTISG
jgi:hypothetical protein